MFSLSVCPIIACIPLLLKSQKAFWQNQAHGGMEPSKWTKLDGNGTVLYLHHPCILCHFDNYALCLVTCVYSRVVEGSGVSLVLHGCVVHVDVHDEVICGWLQRNCYWAWQMCSVLYAEAIKGVHQQYWACMACWSVIFVVNSCCCYVGFLIYRGLWSEQCWVSC